MNNIDYDLKAKVLNNGLYDKYKKYRYISYIDSCYRKFGLVPNKDFNLFIEDSIFEFSFSGNIKELEECERLYISNYKKTKRLRDRITNMFSSGSTCLFLTLTFTDEVLSSTSESTRRVYVRRFLKDYCSSYVANIDYGKTNGREHYHAFVVCDFIEHSNWNYGSINFKRVNNSTNDINRISKYINKITNHALKVTTKRKALIYSRL